MKVPSLGPEFLDRLCSLKHLPAIFLVPYLMNEQSQTIPLQAPDPVQVVHQPSSFSSNLWFLLQLTVRCQEILLREAWIPGPFFVFPDVRVLQKLKLVKVHPTAFRISCKWKNRDEKVEFCWDLKENHCLFWDCVVAFLFLFVQLLVVQQCLLEHQSRYVNMDSLTWTRVNGKNIVDRWSTNGRDNKNRARRFLWYENQCKSNWKGVSVFG